MDIPSQLEPLNLPAAAGAQLDIRQELWPLVEAAPSWLEFCKSLVRYLTNKLGAEGGLVWILSSPGFLSIEHCEGVELDSVLRDEDARKEHRDLSDFLIVRGQTTAVPAQGNVPGQPTIGNPTDYCLLFGIVRSETEPYAILEMLLPEDISPGAMTQAFQMLEQACDFAARCYLRQFQKDTHSRQDLWLKIEEFAYAVHRGLSSKAAGYAIVNEGRRVLDCDWVSLATWNGWKCEVRAVSGMEVIDKRANRVRLLNKLAATVARSEEPVWYEGNSDALPPQIESALEEFISDKHSKVLGVFPLKRASPPSADGAKPPRAEIVGVLIVEQSENIAEISGLRERSELVARHAGEAFANAIEHESLFLMPLWRALGKGRSLLRATRLSTIALVVLGLGLAIGSLFAVPADFEVESKGTLEPVVKRDIFAPQDGLIQSLFVEHGRAVPAGAPLLTMSNTEVSASLADAKGKLAALNEQLRAIDKQRSQIRLTQDERDKLGGQAAQLHASRQALITQVSLLSAKLSQLQVASPIAGQVVTWSPREKLMDRPVQRGQLLLTVADLQGNWLLELHLPQERMGYLAAAQKKLKAGEKLSVRYILATNPRASHLGEVEEIHTTAENWGDEGNTILIKVKIDKADLPGGELHPGASVTAKILCGRASLGYCWFRDVVNFFHHLWFKL